MSPSLRPHQIVIGYNTQNVTVGDVVIVRHNNLEKIKRIHQQADDQVYVVGDNDTSSTDSRHFGWLPRSAVSAKVVWPRSKKHAIIVAKEDPIESKNESTKSSPARK